MAHAKVSGARGVQSAAGRIHVADGGRRITQTLLFARVDTTFKCMESIYQSERTGTHMSKIEAPWTAEQVDGLNAWQDGPMHPFTCGNDHTGGRVLLATVNGWRCPSCDYVQTWAHDFMARPQMPETHPFATPIAPLSPPAARTCEDCGDEMDEGRRRTRCPECGRLVCGWCWNHVHALHPALV